jgi:eukaryotic-like serine/threonine-protein kinase
VPLPSGTHLGPYEILSPLGVGGMGEVYRGRDTRLDRVVAIKILPETLAADPQFRERFDREARAISKLDHPHICALYDVGEHNGISFLVMQYLEGETLGQRMEKGTLPLDQALTIAIQVASALDKAHGSGIVHRDLKPGNVMLTKTGAKLLDFGLAKATNSVVAGAGLSMLPTTPPGLTAQGTILGTLQYMAPEQLEGKETDARTDIFAFGALLYEMLAGRKAFEGQSQASLIAAILERASPPVSTIQPMAPPSLDRVVATCLAKDRDNRWQTARDLVRELRWIADGRAEPATTTSLESRQRAIWLVASGLVAGLLFASLGAVAWFTLRQVPAERSSIRFAVPLPEKAASALDSTLAVSPDGLTLAFDALAADGKRMLWVRPLDSSDTKVLVGSEGAYFPFWSPDSRFIAFFADGKLKKVDTASGNVQTISEASTRGAGGGTWNRDDVIVFAPFLEGGLMRVPAAGGTATPLTTLDAGEGNHAWPYFLPDGRHYIFFLGGGARSGIYAGSLDSKDRTRVIAFDGQIGLSAVAYAPPGYLLFVRHQTLMAQRFDAARLVLIGEAFRLAEGVGDEGPGFPQFSASLNGVLAYRHFDGQISTTQPAWFGRDGKQLSSVGPPGPYETFGLSPDGRTLAVERLDEKERSIWLVDVVRGTTTRFTSGGRSEFPVWSPQGDHIVFNAPSDAPPNPFLRSLNGAEERLLKSPMVSIGSSWSPDGRLLAYTVMDVKTKTDIWVLPLSGDRTPVAFLQTPFDEMDGQISPDGKWMAFTSGESGKNEISVTSFPTPGRKVPISTDGGVGPHWRRDGKELFFVAGRKLMAVGMSLGSAPEPGVPKELFPLPTEIGPPYKASGFYVPASDGQRFLVKVEAAKRAPPPIEVVVNWQAAFRK